VGTLARIRQRFDRLSIFNRVLLGNSIVIVVGAVGGTMLTRQLAVQADLWLILVFSLFGILLSLFVNFAVLRTALRPLRDLIRRVDRVRAATDLGRTLLIERADPDTERLAAAIDSMRARLEEHSLQLRALTMQAISVQEEERKRIARNLHDDTGQALSTLIIALERVETGLAPADHELRPRLQAARELAIRTLEDLRKLVYDLRPSMLDDLGLVPAIRWLARSGLEESGVQWSFEAFDETTRLPAEVETAVFRIAQEAIHNAVRHARAQRVVIRLSLDGPNLTLQVEDDGRGFDVARTSAEAVQHRRLGLLGIQERVGLLGGDLMVDSHPSQGTRLQVRVPLAGLDEAPNG
jgi:two-component system sensor histidine kinase UhpB